MQRTKWTERNFCFDFPEGWIYNILERLRGTHPRICDLVKGYSNASLSEYMAGWSVKEHIGHLTDVEELHAGRIDDLLMRLDKLRSADMTNEKTNEANHNGNDIEYHLLMFEKSRNHFIKKLKNIDDATHVYKALHPRLQVMMRPVDVAYFTAEHDDHHLASIQLILDNIYD